MFELYQITRRRARREARILSNDGKRDWTMESAESRNLLEDASVGVIAHDKHFSRTFARDQRRRGRDEDEVARPVARQERARLEAQRPRRFVVVEDGKRVLAPVRNHHAPHLRRKAYRGGDRDTGAWLGSGRRTELREAGMRVPFEGRHHIAKFADEEGKASVWMKEQMTRTPAMS